ncbi:MAG: branched-chain amino acid ABC transporter permease [Streptosporangiaceae bacterium]
MEPMGTAAEASDRAWTGATVSRLGRGQRVRMAGVAALFVFFLVGLPALLSVYWLDVLTLAAVYSVVALGLGVLMGRVGLVSLGQIAVLALGAWVAARIAFATPLPFPVVLLLAGLITAVLGTMVGLPALRLSGLYLALITLMMAGAITVVLAATNFPNGGSGFLGHTESTSAASVPRPAIAPSDPAYFRYTVIVAALMFLLAFIHVRGKPGRAWAAIRQSEPAALAAGVNITLYKLWAFALASFMTGVGGGLLAAGVGRLYTYQFPTSDSILLLAVVLMGGIYSLWGAIVAGILMKVFPAVLDIWNLPADLLTILFGIGAVQVLATAPAGLAAQVPRDLARLGRLVARVIKRYAGRRKGRQ